MATRRLGHGTMSHIDPATDVVVTTITVSAGPINGGDIAVGGGSVWVRVSNPLVVQIYPGTAKVVERYGPSSGPRRRGGRGSGLD